jgi:hypothetical protein
MWPRVLWLSREQLVADRVNTHAAHSRAHAQALAERGASQYRLGLTPLTGARYQNLYVTGCDSFVELSTARMERRMHLAPDAEPLHSRREDIIVVRREDGICGDEESLEDARLIRFIAMQIRPGYSTDYTELVDGIIKANAVAGNQDRFAVYQMHAGGSPGWHVVVQLMNNLGDDDAGGLGHRRGGPGDNAELHRRTLGDDQAERMRSISRAAVEFAESQIWEVDPYLCYVTQQFAAKNDPFWSDASIATN